MKQGISQLELLFQEFRREDRIKQRRKQVRKLKKRRKKERKNAGATLNTHSSGTIINNDDEDADSDNDEVIFILFLKDYKKYSKKYINFIH